MAITFRSVATTGTGASPRTVSAPAGLAEGDLLVLVFSADTTDVVPTVPSGFVEVVAAQIAVVPSLRLFLKTAGPAEPADYSVTYADGTARVVGLMALTPEVGNTIEVDALATQQNGVADRLFPSVTTTVADTFLACFATLAAASATTPPVGSTERWDTATDPRLFLMTETVAAIGATGTRTATGTDQDNNTITVAFKEVEPGATLTAPTDLAAVAISDTEIDLSWTDTATGETGWKVQRSPAGAGTWAEIADIAANSTGYSDTGLTAATAYDYRVFAYEDVTDGGFSNTATETTDAAPEYAPIAQAAPEIYRLFLLQPEVVFAAQVNASVFSYPLSEVVYDNVTVGSFSDVEIGQTIFFGTTSGDFNLGAQRVRAAADASKIYFGRSSRGKHQGEVDLSDDVFFVVLDLREVWGRPPFIAADGEVWKDPGLPVEWRTTTPPPVANTGAAFCRTIDPITGLITVALPPSVNTSFATAAPGGLPATISSYLWDLKDGTVVSGTVNDSTLVATFPAGFRYVDLTVTDSEGHFHTAYCPIFARDPDADLTIPFQFQSHTITPDGQRIAVRVLADIPATTYPPGTLALIWRGEPADMFDRGHMIFTGWLGNIPASIQAERTATLRDTTLELLDVAGRLDTLPGFTQRVEDDSIRVALNTAAVAAGKTPPNPAITWSHIVGLNMDLYIHYLLAWHSTALSLADFHWSGTGSAYAATGLHSDGQSLWDQMARKVASLVPVHRLTCDRRGAIRMLPDPGLQPPADRTSDAQGPGGGLTAAHWSDIRYTHQRHPRAHWLRANAVGAGVAEVAAVAAQIATGVPKPTLTTYFSIAPGDAPGQGEAEQMQGEQLALSQAALNEATGQQYARFNAQQSEYEIPLAAGDDFGIDPALMTWVPLTLPPELAAQRGLSFTASRGLVKAINLRYSHAREGLTKTVVLTWERETVGIPGVTVIKPVAPTPDEPAWPGDFHGEPPPTPTPPPPVEPFIPPLPLYSGQEVVALLDTEGNIFRTSNFTSGGASPTYDRKVLTGPSNSERIHSFVVNPFSPLYRGLGTTVNGWAASENYIFFIDDIFGATPTATQVYEFPEIANPALDRFRSIQASFGRFRAAEADNPWLVVISHYANRPGFEGTWSTVSTDGGQTWVEAYNLSSSYDGNVGINRNGNIGVYLSPRTPGLAFSATYTDGFEPMANGEISTDWGQTWQGITNPGITAPAIDPGDFLGGDFHVPWADNENELICYFGGLSKGTLWAYRLTRTDSAGALDALISPSFDGRNWGVGRFGFGVRTHDNNRSFVALAGIANDSTDSEDDDVFAAFVSSNGGDTWTNIVATLAKSVAHPEHIAFANDTEQIIYLWGSLRYIAYSDDFGATIQDKTGNLLSAFPTDVRDIIGLCGGESPP